MLSLDFEFVASLSGDKLRARRTGDNDLDLVTLPTLCDCNIVPVERRPPPDLRLASNNTSKPFCDCRGMMGRPFLALSKHSTDKSRNRGNNVIRFRLYQTRVS